MYYVIGKNNCVWCDKAKVLLEKAEKPFLYKNLSTLSPEKKEAWVKFITEDLSMKTVPVVLQLTGGYEQLEAAINNG